MVSSKPIASAESTASFLALMGNERRLLIMGCPTGGEMSFSAIAKKVLLGQSVLSQHLAETAGTRSRRNPPRPADDLLFPQSEAARDLLQMPDGIFGDGDLSPMTYRLRRAGEIIHKENANADWPVESVKSR